MNIFRSLVIKSLKNTAGVMKVADTGFIFNLAELSAHCNLISRSFQIHSDSDMSGCVVNSVICLSISTNLSHSGQLGHDSPHDRPPFDVTFLLYFILISIYCSGPQREHRELYGQFTRQFILWC